VSTPARVREKKTTRTSRSSTSTIDILSIGDDKRMAMVVTADQATEIHRHIVVDCAAELLATYDAARPQRVALIVENPRELRMHIGFGTRDEVVTELLELEQAGGLGAAQLAAQLAAGEDVRPGKFLCVVIAAGLAACYEFDLMLIELEKYRERE